MAEKMDPKSSVSGDKPTQNALFDSLAASSMRASSARR